jgi:hypothetical protein
MRERMVENFVTEIAIDFTSNGETVASVCERELLKHIHIVRC